MKRPEYYLTILVIIVSTFIWAQNDLNPNPLKKLISEKENLSKSHTILPVFPNKKNFFQATINQHIDFNTNLPNLENWNGLYIPRGRGTKTSVLFQYRGKNLMLSAEPQLNTRKEYAVSLPEKTGQFAVLNDVPFNPNSDYGIVQIKNAGAVIGYKGLGVGYGNWNQWWGPGIHNSLVLSNNSEGFPHLFIGTMEDMTLAKNFKGFFKAIVGNMGRFQRDYFLSAYIASLSYKSITMGTSKHILSGALEDISWSFKDAALVLLNKKNMPYWDRTRHYFVSVNFPGSDLTVFMEWVFPQRAFNGEDSQIYWDHAMASNMGLRKYGAFGNDDFMFGFEYTRLVQGIYYNTLPTPNWYGNIKYNYSSYRGRRWTAHSGSDSDDFLLFFGWMKDTYAIISGFNYERHGVTFHFPPEVKFELRLALSYKIRDFWFYINYEKEYFEHYGFVDVNQNVWLETFEPGSIQRTSTFLFGFERTLSF